MGEVRKGVKQEVSEPKKDARSVANTTLIHRKEMESVGSDEDWGTCS